MRTSVLAFILLRIATAAACMGSCMVFMVLGIDYVTGYHGLHPILAGLGALASASACALLLMNAYDEFLTERERLSLVLEYTNKHLPIHIWPDRAP